MINHRLVTTLALLIFLSPCLSLAAEVSNAGQGAPAKSFAEMFGKGPQEEDVYRNDRLLVTATGSQKPVHLAPSVASVITDDDILAMGATTLDEALEGVPGLHVEPAGSIYFSSIYSIRGLHTAVNPQVLLLINGVPFSMNYYGGRPIAYRMPTAMISRIEVVRGPGSALHGADAFAGTINVITKDNFEIDGSRAGVRLGSFDTVDTWVQQGGQYGGWDLALGVEWQETRGDHDRIVSRDAVWFPPYNAPALSNAPAPLHTGIGIVDSHLNLRRRDWTLHLYGQLQDGDHAGAGLAQAITEGNEIRNTILLSDISYTNDHSLPDWTLNGRLYTSYMVSDNTYVILQDTVVAPQGQVGNPISDNRDLGLEFSTVYEGIVDHQLRLGGGYKNYEYTPDQYKNFNLPAALGYKQCVPALYVFGPITLGPMTHITDPDCLFMPPANRHLFYGLTQDEWSLGRAWTFTYGLRYDEYSDFGSTVNPRAALVWETRYDLTTKLMYGTAFRAPALSELYVAKNPQSMGNPKLNPEEIETGELAFDYQPSKDLRLILSLFAYQAQELIDLVGPLPQVYTNYGTVQGKGFELEGEWQVLHSLRLRANFAYQRAENTTVEALVADAPGRQFTLNPYWEFMEDWSLDGQMHWIADRPRAKGDPRPEISDYELVNLTLRRTNIAAHWEVALAVRNLFDEGGRIPSPYAPNNPAGAGIPDDYPMEGRAVWAEVSCHF